METVKEKRVKREIANSNERRRMQSINAGFQKLKRLLPVSDGEKLSKAQILQHASEFIQQIEREKLLLHEQNTLIRGILKDGTDISTVLDNVDALPIIPITKTIILNRSNDDHTTNSNDTTTDNNSYDDCIERRPTTQRRTNNRSNSKNNKEVNNNNNNENNQRTTTTTTTTTTHGATHVSAMSSKSDEINSSSSSSTNNKKKDDKCNNKNQSIVSDRVTSPKNGLASTGVAKAAIALPLEVPYTSETAIRVDIHHHHHHHQDLQPGSPNTTNARKMLKTEEPAPKGQNLDTICKAIMEIEGDRVFKNENSKKEHDL